jgi:hypothetical protein
MLSTVGQAAALGLLTVAFALGGAKGFGTPAQPTGEDTS